MRTLLLLSALLISLNSCKSIQKMVDKGDYDGAIAFAAKKLEGKENKKTKYVKGLERAFAKITAEDMATYRRLTAEERSENWDRIYNILARIDTRQQVISPLIPLTSNEGYKATFKFVKVDGPLLNAKQKATAFHYQRGKELMLQARAGDKTSARDAHHAFNSIQRYYRDFNDSRALGDEAKYLGTTRILIALETPNYGSLPYDFQSSLIGIRPTELNSTWTEFHLDIPRDVSMDFTAVIDLVRVDISRDEQDRRVFRESKRIEDGEKYVLDGKGNVKKDSLGNDITEPKFVDIEARVIEFQRRKSAFVEAEIRIIDLQSENLIDRDKVSTEVLFSNISSEVRGDRRALSEDNRRRLNGLPEPFPTESDMLITAATQMSYDLRNKLRRSFI